MIAIGDYDAGNIRSVVNALSRVGAQDVILTSDAARLRSARPQPVPEETLEAKLNWLDDYEIINL